RAVRLGKEPAVQQAYGLEYEAPRAPLLVPGEKLLRHRVAVVVREHVHASDAEPDEQRLLDVRLLGHRVRVRARLAGEAEAEHVERDDEAEARGERVPDVMPVP